MGSIISQQNSEQVSERSQSSSLSVNKNWKVLQKSLQKQILQSKKTQLVVERYWFQIQHHQDFQSQNKLFEWRNTNPNSESMVNVLSVGKDEFVIQNQAIQCGWCPSQRVINKVYVVTERILKLDQLTEFLAAKQQIGFFPHKNKSKVLYAIDEKKSPIINQNHKKFKPFLQMSLNPNLFAQLMKDWLRGIEVLCYKFGYFKINPQLLGITIRQRGTVWITSNYAMNSLSTLEKVQVSTAEQKFKYEKDTISKILNFLQKVDSWKGIINQLNNCERFEQVLKLLEKIEATQKKVHKKQKRKSNNSSLFVEQGSLLNPNFSVMRLDQDTILQRLHSDKKVTSQEKVSLVNSSKLNGKNLGSSCSNKSMTKKSMKRSNTGQKEIKKSISPENKHGNQVFINSNHKYGGRQTAPTNELGQSSSLQSVNHLSQRGNIELRNMMKEGQKMFLAKSQNDNFLINQAYEQDRFGQEGNSSPNHKVYYPNHIQRNYLLSQPHVFRSHANISLDLDYKNPFTFNKQIQHQAQKYSPKQNYSLDEINMIGPYRTDRVYSNLKKQKIALVDSMVQVREQSQQIDDQFHHGQKTKIIMEESIIIRGKENQNLLSQLYE